MVEWNVDPIIFKIGFFSLRWYSLFFATAFLSSFYIMRWMFIREGVSLRVLDDLFVYIFLGVLIGARLGHVLFYDPSYYLHNPMEIPQIWKGGLASHGAFIGVFVAGFIFVRRHHSISYLWILDRMAIPVPLAAAFVRFGNLFNSEIFGKPTSAPWAFIFERVDRIPRHPTQLYEAITYLFIFLLMLFLYNKKGLREKKGFYAGVWLAVTFTARFLIEFTKERQASFGWDWPLNVGQLLSIVPVALGLFLVAYAMRRGGSQTKGV